MVFCVRGRARASANREDVVMVMRRERSSKSLHNFTLPYLKWGHQRHLRCMKLEDSSATTTTTTTAFIDQHPRRRSPPSKLRKESEDASRRSRMAEGDEKGIEAVREKIINDLKTAADKMKDAIFREKVMDEEEEEEESPSTEVAAAVVSAPWNLRTRRAACKAPVGGAASNKGFKFEERKPNASPIRSEAVDAKSPRLLSGDKEVEKERVKFSVNLTRKEIEEDFMTLVGHRPPRRPKKRPRVVQKQLDTLFPGLWLTEVTVDLYKVPELAENGQEVACLVEKKMRRKETK